MYGGVLFIQYAFGYIAMTPLATILQIAGLMIIPAWVLCYYFLYPNFQRYIVAVVFANIVIPITIEYFFVALASNPTTYAFLINLTGVIDIWLFIIGPLLAISMTIFANERWIRRLKKHPNSFMKDVLDDKFTT